MGRMLIEGVIVMEPKQVWLRRAVVCVSCGIAIKPPIARAYFTGKKDKFLCLDCEGLRDSLFHESDDPEPLVDDWCVWEEAMNANMLDASFPLTRVNQTWWSILQSGHCDGCGNDFLRPLWSEGPRRTCPECGKVAGGEREAIDGRHAI